MNLDFQGTPLPFPSAGKSVPLFGGFSLVREGGTPLLDPSNNALGETITVRTDIVRQYQQIIFQLEQQVYEYRTLLNRVLHKEPTPDIEDEAMLSSPLNAASIEMVNSIIYAQVDNDAILRAYDDDEED